MWLVDALRFPYFHPKDSPDLVREFGVDKAVCQYHQWKTGLWINVSPGSPAMNIGGVDRQLNFRTKGVERGEGMPSRGVAQSVFPQYVTLVCLSNPLVIVVQNVRAERESQYATRSLARHAGHSVDSVVLC